MQFKDEDGFVTRLRFFKQVNNTGTHVGHLWSGTGELLATLGPRGVLRLALLGQKNNSTSQ